MGTVALDEGGQRQGRRAAVRLHSRFELRCSCCGYGVVVRIAPDRCPMCAGAVWEHPRRLEPQPALLR